ncbi:MAG: hypothetical protein HY866_03130 [Chloroflexi bacterium]|nr:hypothetical protein [Chloroflexota bacterium]
MCRPTTVTPQPMIRRLVFVLLILLLSVPLAACGGKSGEGDPVKVSRDFMIATWTGDTRRVRELSCEGVQWTMTGDPTLTIDAEHLKFEVVSKAKKNAEVVMSGVVTFKSAAGQSEIRNLDELGQTRFVLEDHDGWKVCDVR